MNELIEKVLQCSVKIEYIVYVMAGPRWLNG